MRKQKRYESEIDIVSEINSQKRNLEAALKQSVVEKDLAKKYAIDASMPELKPHRSKFLQDKSREHLKKAKVQEKKAYRIENSKLPKLKELLAAFNTEMLPMPETASDKAVVLA